MFSPTVPFDEAQVARLDAWLDEVYSDFTHKAADDRRLDWTVLERQARGRVWTGSDAHERDLVDELGGRQRAVELVCELAGLDRDQNRLQAVPHLASESTESPAAALGAPVASLLPRDTDDAIRLAGDYLGLPLAGVLSMPWRFTLG